MVSPVEGRDTHPENPVLNFNDRLTGILPDLEEVQASRSTG
jgi:hypothetical protein